MSLTSSPDCLIRPEDKALKMLFASNEEPMHNSFDDFFNHELKEFNDEDNERGSPTTDNFLNIDFLQHNNPVSISKIPCEDAPQPWRKGVWCLNSKPAPDLIVGKTRKAGRPTQKFISPACLEHNENCVTRSPASTAKMGTKPVATSPKPTIFDNNQFVHNTMTRDQTLSPTPARSRAVANKKIVGNGKWQQDFQNFDLQMPDDGIYLTPHHNFLHANAKVMARNATIAHPPQSPTKYHYPFNHVARPLNGDVEANLEAIAPETSINHSRKKSGHPHLGTRPHAGAGHNSGIVWTTESLVSSDSSHNSQGSQYSNDSYQHPCPSQLPHNWPALASNMPILFAAQDLGTEIAAPTPQRIPHQVLYYQQEPHQAGLGIHYANADEIGVAVSYEPKYEYEDELRSLTPPQLTNIPAISYPPLPPYPPHTFQDTSPFTTPRRRTTSPSRSPSPSLSPSRRPPSHTFTHRSPTRQDETRRKSLHRRRPISIVKDPTPQDTTTFTTPSTSRARTRSLSRARQPRTPRTPRTPTTGNFDVDCFVNYTPKDSAKLMSDVAPSGSSKTRARREQEAREKRKRLSEAAVLAVRRAGGDVSALGEVILV